MSDLPARGTSPSRIARKCLTVLSVVLLLSLCACGSEKKQPVSSDAPPQEEFDVIITAGEDDAPPREVACTFRDGEDSAEVYYISFTCNVDGVIIERVDENGIVQNTLFEGDGMTPDQCLRLITTVPEGYPNTRISAVCGESENAYLLGYNGQDGGALLLPQD